MPKRRRRKIAVCETDLAERGAGGLTVPHERGSQWVVAGVARLVQTFTRRYLFERRTGGVSLCEGC